MSQVNGVRKDTCKNCIYFDKFPTQKKPDNVIGACKANPPSPAPPAYDATDNKLGVWPLVLGTFWCGMFFDANTKENKDQ